jgi:hypothetical protein
MQKNIKKKFLLDCCNPVSSKLSPYESKRDNNLAAYFAMKKQSNRGTSRKTLKKSKTKEKKLLMPVPVLTSFNTRKSSSATHLPPIKPKQTEVKTLSRDELTALISKFREDLKVTY